MFTNTIYIDLDGVIADFDGYCISLIGKKLSDFNDSNSGWEALGFDKYTMFKHLKPIHDSKALINGVFKFSLKYKYNVAVLTAIPKNGRIPYAKSHKKEWVYNNFPELSHDFNIGPYAEDKQKHCVVGDILIDDSKLNIPQWKSAGGIGILHTSAVDSLNQLKDILLGSSIGRAVASKAKG